MQRYLVSHCYASSNTKTVTCSCLKFYQLSRGRNAISQIFGNRPWALSSISRISMTNIKVFRHFTYTYVGSNIDLLRLFHSNSKVNHVSRMCDRLTRSKQSFKEASSRETPSSESQHITVQKTDTCRVWHFHYKVVNIYFKRKFITPDKVALPVTTPMLNLNGVNESELFTLPSLSPIINQGDYHVKNYLKDATHSYVSRSFTPMRNKMRNNGMVGTRDRARNV